MGQSMSDINPVTESVLTENAQAESVQAENVQAESVQAENAQAESLQAESVQAESAQAESVQAESVQAESVQAESVQAESLQAEPTFSPLVPAPKEPRCALITGAASGIGRCVAIECAKKGWPLVIVDINQEGLDKVTETLRSEYNVTVYPFVIDLSTDDAPERCLDFCDKNGLEIDLLANIAGVFIFGPLLEADVKKTTLLLNLHVKTLTRMCVLFGERMKQRRYGYIMNMSSMSAWMPMPGISTYNATKSYVRSVSRSLGFELKPWNVSVTAVCPGGCNTPLIKISDKLRKLAVNLRFLMPPEKLAKKALKATLRKKTQTIPGFLNHIFTAFIILIPDWLVFVAMRCVPPYKRFFPEKEAKDKA